MMLPIFDVRITVASEETIYGQYLRATATLDGITPDCARTLGAERDGKFIGIGRARDAKRAVVFALESLVKDIRKPGIGSGVAPTGDKR